MASAQQLADLAAAAGSATPAPRRSGAAVDRATPSPGKPSSPPDSPFAGYEGKRTGSIRAGPLGHTVVRPRPITSEAELRHAEATLGHALDTAQFSTPASLPITQRPAGQTSAATPYHHRQLRALTADQIAAAAPAPEPAYRSGRIVSSPAGQTRIVPHFDAAFLATLALPPEPEYHSHTIKAKNAVRGRTSAGLEDPRKLP